MDANAALIRLKTELAERGWASAIRPADGGPILYVANPDAPALNEKIICDGRQFFWSHGQAIGPVDSVRGAGALILHVLRVVADHRSADGS